MSITSFISVSCLTTTGFRVIISKARMLSRFLPCLIARSISTVVTIPMTLILLPIMGKPLKFPIRSLVKTDVTNEDDVRALVEKTVKVYKRLDYAFNNAGMEETITPLIEQTSDVFDQIMNVNVK